MYIYIFYIYIYIERERERNIFIYIYIYSLYKYPTDLGPLQLPTAIFTKCVVFSFAQKCVSCLHGVFLGAGKNGKMAKPKSIFAILHVPVKFGALAAIRPRRGYIYIYIFIYINVSTLSTQRASIFSSDLPLHSVLHAQQSSCMRPWNLKLKELGRWPCDFCGQEPR